MTAQGKRINGSVPPLPSPHTLRSVVWDTAPDLVPYPDALAVMDERVDAIRAGFAPEMVWLLEHPPLYTAGTSAKPADLLSPTFPVFESGRGGQFTYHGPGQRVAYVMLDLKSRTPDVRWYVHSLEEWLITALRLLGVEAVRRAGRVGLWVPRSDGQADDKIAAIGVRIRRWVTFHGISLNVNPDLTHYAGIVPCGIRAHGITSLQALGKSAPLETVDTALKTAWASVFGA